MPDSSLTHAADPPVALDVLLFGGGVAGLWLLDALRRAGYAALLVESGELGAGQTVAAQGIIHGGLKYTLDGMLSGSAEAIREAPRLWRERLAGETTPDLREVRVRAEHCYLWRTESLLSRIGAIGARVGLRVRPERLTSDERPEVLRHCPGEVYRLAEPVIDPCSLLAVLAQANHEYLIRVESADTEMLEGGALVRLSAGAWRVELAPRVVVLTAGAGIESIRARLGLPADAAQRRPLHMTLVRGDLPTLNGHCVDAGHTRVTITSDVDSSGRTVWQVGGQIAERGVEMDERELLAHARRELAEALPGLRLDGLGWSTYRIDRAERRHTGGRRPDDAAVLCEGRIISAWPTKLALAPRLAERVLETLDPPGCDSAALMKLAHEAPRPRVARAPWEVERTWYRDP